MLRRLCFALIVVLLAPCARGLDVELRLAVPEGMNETYLSKWLGPLGESLAQSPAPVTLTFTAIPSAAASLEALSTGVVDLGLVGPLDAARLVRKESGQPIAAFSPAFMVAIAVPGGSAVNDLGDLVGKRVVFGKTDSFFLHLLPVGMLRKAGVPPEQLAGMEFRAEPSEVVLALGEGVADAGVLPFFALESMAGGAVRSIALSDGVPGVFMVGRAGLEDATLDALKAGLMSYRPSADQIREGALPAASAVPDGAIEAAVFVVEEVLREHGP